jgi:hypothetical protein
VCINNGKEQIQSSNYFGIVFKLEGNTLCIISVWQCNESKVTFDCMLFIIQDGIIPYYTTHFLPNAIIQSNL